MREFVHVGQPARVVFGAGSLRHLPRELELFGARRALVLSTPGHSAAAEGLVRDLGGRAAGVFARALMHVPLEMAREARTQAARLHADCLVALGGGSTTGLAKAIALESGVPIIAVPTTYAGSEVTPIYGLTEGGVKRTGRDARVLPRVVIYDPELTLDLPLRLSITSGMNAIAHAAEGLYARDGNPLTELLAEEAIRCVAGALPSLHASPRDLAARTQALYGAWLCGTVLGTVGMALHHKLCHTLGGSFALPHAEVHAVVLPHAIEYNAAAAPQAMSALARALRSEAPARALYALARTHGAPYSLRELGMRAADLDRAAELASADPYWNPRPIERSAVRTLLQHAWEGTPPG